MSNEEYMYIANIQAEINAADAVPRESSIIRRLYEQTIKNYVSLIVNNASFRWLWFSALFSNGGQYFAEIALLSSLEKLTKQQGYYGGLLISGVLLCMFIPPILSMYIAGVCADCLPKELLMLCADAARSACVLFLLIAIPRGDELILVEHLWVIYVVIASLSFFGSFFDPAREGLVPSIVSEKYLLSANSLDSLTWMASFSVGSGLGGLTSMYLGPWACIIVNSVTYLLSAGFVLLLVIERRRQRPRREEQEEITYLPSIQEASEKAKPYSGFRKLGAVLLGALKDMVLGLVMLVTHPYILSLALLRSISAFTWSPEDLVTVKYGDTIFRIGKDSSSLLGVVKIITGVTAGFAPIVTERFISYDRPRIIRGTILISFVLMLLGFVLIWLAPTVHIAVFLFGHACVGWGSGVVWVLVTVSLQQAVPEHYLGRIFAYDLCAFLNSAQASGVFLGGLLLDNLKLEARQIALFQAMACFVCIIGVSYWWLETFHIGDHTLYYQSAERQADAMLKRLSPKRSQPPIDEVTEDTHLIAS